MKRASWKGRFIVLEGIDGAGTTTQAELISAELRGDGYKVSTTGEPSDGPVGMLIRQALRGRLGLPARGGSLTEGTLALLFAADRLDHLEAEVFPALGRGEVVICDRYVLSSLAYQGAACPMDWVEEINDAAVSPDLTIFIEVDFDTAARRRASRGSSEELFEADQRQRKVIRQYAAAIRQRESREKILRIDGNRPLEQVTRDALEATRGELSKVAKGAVR